MLLFHILVSFQDLSQSENGQLGKAQAVFTVQQFVKVLHPSVEYICFVGEQTDVYTIFVFFGHVVVEIIIKPKYKNRYYQSLIHHKFSVPGKKF